MQTFQERVLGKVDALCARYGLSATVASDYANTGSVYIMENVADVDAMAEVRYNFQSGNYTLSLKVRDKWIPSQPGRADYFDFYHANGERSDFWRVFENQLGALTGQAT